MEWAAVLVHWPAALTRQSALPKPPESGPIHVAIDVLRTVRPVRGVVAQRTSDLESRARWVKSPPRIAIEHAVIDVAAALHDDPLAMFRILADTCQTRRTSALRIAEVLRGRGRVPHKALLLAMLDDLATGACSVLEREYLHAVERRHGLPEGRRQKPIAAGRRSGYQDVDYEEYGVKVELDGRAFHDNAVARDLDAERDLDALVSENACTVRLTYGLVFGAACRTAAKLAALLNRKGWPASLVPCPDCPSS